MLLALWPLFIVHTRHVEPLDVHTATTQRARIAHVQQQQRRKREKTLQPEEITNGTRDVHPTGSARLDTGSAQLIDAQRSPAAFIPLHDAGIQLTMNPNARIIAPSITVDSGTSLDAALARAREDEDAAMIIILMGLT